MATRRIISSQGTLLEKDDHTDLTPAAGDVSNIRPAVPPHVIFKLLAFTVAMMGLPICVYFLTLNKLFHGNATFAGATAAVTANVVLIAYIVVAMREDESEAIEAAEKKGR